jgi:hypothetical protein
MHIRFSDMDSSRCRIYSASVFKQNECKRAVEPIHLEKVNAQQEFIFKLEDNGSINLSLLHIHRCFATRDDQ